MGNERAGFVLVDPNHVRRSLHQRADKKLSANTYFEKVVQSSRLNVFSRNFPHPSAGKLVFKPQWNHPPVSLAGRVAVIRKGFPGLIFRGGTWPTITSIAVRSAGFRNSASKRFSASKSAPMPSCSCLHVNFGTPMRM